MPVVSSFQLIATAIDVCAHLGNDKNFGVDISDAWALYYWTLSPLESGPNKLETNVYELLKYVPGNVLKGNLTDSHRFPSKATFEVDDIELYTKAVADLVFVLKEKYLNTNKLNEANFLSDCGNLIVSGLRENIPSKISESTEGISYIGFLALRSLFKSSYDLHKDDVLSIRATGIFWISTFIVTWNFKN